MPRRRRPRSRPRRRRLPVAARLERLTTAEPRGRIAPPCRTLLACHDAWPRLVAPRVVEEAVRHRLQGREVGVLGLGRDGRRHRDARDLGGESGLRVALADHLDDDRTPPTQSTDPRAHPSRAHHPRRLFHTGIQVSERAGHRRRRRMPGSDDTRGSARQGALHVIRPAGSDRGAGLDADIDVPAACRLASRAVLHRRDVSSRLGLDPRAPLREPVSRRLRRVLAHRVLLGRPPQRRRLLVREGRRVHDAGLHRRSPRETHSDRRRPHSGSPRHSSHPPRALPVAKRRTAQGVQHPSLTERPAV